MPVLEGARNKPVCVEARKSGVGPAVATRPTCCLLSHLQVSGICEEAHTEMTAELQRLSGCAMAARDERDRLRAEMAAVAREVRARA